jgi:hypothetical protein
MSSAFKSFKVESPLGYTVSCSKENWSHIERHEIMKENRDAVIDAVGDPVAVYSSEEWPDKRDIYFGRSSKATYGESLYTKVVVNKPTEYISDGEVVSAWPQKDISGNIKEGGLLYVKSRPGQKKRYTVHQDE